MCNDGCVSYNNYIISYICYNNNNNNSLFILFASYTYYSPISNV